MSIELKGKVCVITGAAQGVGYGLAQGFLKRGAIVVAGTRKAETPAGLEGALCLKMDVSNKEDVERGISQAIKEFGRVDVLINNAGIYPRTPADEVSEEEWDRVINTNLQGTWNCCKAVIPQMKEQKQGVIINVGSVTFGLGMEHLVHYLSSKGGVVGMTRALARDLGQYGIRSNCLHLGAVTVPTEKLIFPDSKKLDEILNEKQSMPGRLTPETIEPIFAFFASDDSLDITGQCLNIDRGWVMG